jgi:hypothetical protein
MDQELTLSDKYLVSILESFHRGTKYVKSISTIKGFNYSIKMHEKLRVLLMSKSLEAVHDLENWVESPQLEEQYLYVMTFTNQDNLNYSMIVYDNNELWHNPEILDVFPM